MASSNNRQIPVRLNEFKSLDSEFANIRSRFDSEMKKMEEDMNKFRDEMMNRDSSFFRSANNTSAITSSSSVSTSSKDDNKLGDLLPGGGLGSHSNWLKGVDSSLVGEDGNQKEIRLRFDVSQYMPEDIIVKTVDNKLLVHAKHEEEKDGKTVFREYNREFLLPSGTDPEQIRSTLTKDGILTVEAPLPQPAITQEK